MKGFKLLKNTKGITLIALVVTIVVLLILAAVSISMLTGENGIITQAQQSKDETEQAKCEEFVTVAINGLIAENGGDRSKITPEKIAEQVNKENNRTDVTAEGSTFPTNIIFNEEGRKVGVDIELGVTGEIKEEIYSADVSEEDIAPTDIFKYEIISEAETGATSLDSLPTKEARITGIKEKYCNSFVGRDSSGATVYGDANYEIVLDDGSKITDTLVVPYQVEIDNEMYRITEVDLAIYWYTSRGVSGYTLPNVKIIIYPNTVRVISGINHKSGADRYRTIQKIVLPQKLQIIGENSFWDCMNLLSIQIPGSVTSIGGSAFLGCSNSLTSITVDSSNTIYDSRDNCNAIIETNTNTLLVGCKNTIIPSSVTSIGNSAFYYCSSLTSIKIPISVTSIGRSAFDGCSRLETVNYTGTMEQWQQVAGRDELKWKQIICTDGTINE